MAQRSLPPFRADHVGSLLRPASLLAARADHDTGRVSAEDLRATEDAAIREAVRMQESVGLQSATDGELRRASWHMDFIYRLGGISKAKGRLAVSFRNEQGSTSTGSSSNTTTPAPGASSRGLGLSVPASAAAPRVRCARGAAT